MPAAVPADRVADFYARHAAWLADGAAPEQQDAANLVDWTDDDAERAGLVWARLSERAKALFSALMASPGTRIKGSALAEDLSIPNGMYGVAGVLAWPARHAAKVDRPLPVSFEYGEAGEGATYWMDEPAASLFQAAAAATQEG